MTLKEAADTLGVTPDTLRQQIARHALRARKMGRDWYVTPAEVEKYRKEHRRVAPEPVPLSKYPSFGEQWAERGADKEMTSRLVPKPSTHDL